ncbi:MAG: 2,3-bisphosphoglycerate-independent phosphoglycerate mutase [Bacillota bacterium]|jgi:2,3-bisphosphoglycerate-independent phosphoglycerate mutase
MTAKKPVMLCILDGWGMKTGLESDTFTVAKVPVFDKMMAEMPNTTLEASGEAVGLPAGQIGNSEVGHLNIGAGRVVYQDLTRITKSVNDGDFYQNPVFLNAMQTVKENDSKLHFFGLLSNGGVHSDIFHLKSLLLMAKMNGVKKAFVHCFLDGRDVKPTSGADFLKELRDFMADIEFGEVATVGGRFYAMDRDKRWDRVETAWRTMVLGEGEAVADYVARVEKSYEDGVTDEFVVPFHVVDEKGDFKGRITDGDSIIFYNFRADRAREITRAFYEKDFAGFERPVAPHVAYACMTEYDATFPLPVAYPKEVLSNTLGEYVAKMGKKQLRIAETEKYAHVTFFFNGGVEAANPDEDRILVPSPKVATYDLQPEMSAEEVTEKVLAAIKEDTYDLIILNFANPDMVGHTGIMPAAVKAVEKVDCCLGRIQQAVAEAGGVLLVTADHGNVEKMFEADGTPVTAHTTNKVPFIVAGYPCELRSGGALKDISPTLLQILELPQPKEMLGETLIK